MKKIHNPRRGVMLVVLTPYSILQSFVAPRSTSHLGLAWMSTRLRHSGEAYWKLPYFYLYSRENAKACCKYWPTSIYVVCDWLTVSYLLIFFFVAYFVSRDLIDKWLFSCFKKMLLFCLTAQMCRANVVGNVEISRLYISWSDFECLKKTRLKVSIINGQVRRDWCERNKFLRNIARGDSWSLSTLLQHVRLYFRLLFYNVCKICLYQ